MSEADGVGVGVGVGVGTTEDLQFAQFREFAALMHAEAQPGRPRERELRVEFVPVQLVDEVRGARGHLEKRVLGHLRARVDNVDGCWRRWR